MKHFGLIALLLLASGCGTSTTIHGMYLKQNYLQIVPYADQYESLDDYGVWKVCQSLAKVELFDEFYVCKDELKSKLSAGKGPLAEFFTPTMLTAMYDAMDAEIALGLGQYDEAVALSEKVIQLMEAEPYEEYLIFDNGRLAYEATRVLLRARAVQGDKEKMLEAIEDAKRLALYRYVGDGKKRFQAIKFRIVQEFLLSPILTEAYFAIGEYEQALAYSTETIDMMENIGFLRSTLYASITAFESTVTGARTAEGKMQSFADTMFANKLLPRIIKARSELELGDFESAKLGFDEVLSTGLITGMRRLYYPVLHDRGRVAEALGDDEAAAEFYRQSIEVIETSRSSIQDDAAKISYVGNKQEVFQSLVRVLYRQGKLTEAFQVAENAKSRALVDLLAGKDDIVPLSPNAVSAAAVDSLNALVAANATKNLVERAESRSADIQTYRTAAKNLRDAAPEYASLVTSEPTQLKDVQRLLSPGELLLEYYETDSRLLIFSISSSDIKAYSVQAPQLSALVSEFRQSLADINNDDYQTIGSELYDLLLKPVAVEVAQANGLTIVPHGVLHYVPFVALYSAGQFLIEQKPTRVLPSASVLQFLDKGHRGDASLLVLGNPDRNDSNMDLPGAEREAVAIVERNRASAAGGTNTVLLLRKQATETAIKQTAAQFQYVHFASHGVFDDSAPLNSRLLLVKDNKNDGDLTVSELYGLKLNADLVTLSACETALGDVANGDDVVGFTRGFLYAGANSIVSSLWEVDDQATNLLMQSFYQNLRTMNKREALTQAILSTKQSYQHPYYWAAFQLTGSI